MGSIESTIGSGKTERFDQRQTVFSRTRDPEKSSAELLEMGKKFIGMRKFKNLGSNSLLNWAFSRASWYLEHSWGMGLNVGNEKLYEWFPDSTDTALKERIPAGEKWEVSDAEEMKRIIKKAAKYMGASDVGICKLDKQWVYSKRFDPRTGDHTTIDEIPEDFEHVIVLVLEMDYQLIQTSPAWTENAATGQGYSDMAYVTSSVAHFIRDLGYQAIPCGNDTALSIPMAIDAGLGELGRNGILITPRFGPRVRFSKVLTNLPLVSDKPINIGVRKMCDVCGKCATACPSRAISFGVPTTQGTTISNNGGIYKWYINPEKCFNFWVKNQGDCANCIRSCVFNKPDTWLHRLVRWHVKNLPLFNKIYLWMDDLFGYGKKMKTEEVWK